jgi:hypothetical protein
MGAHESGLPCLGSVESACMIRTARYLVYCNRGILGATIDRLGDGNSVGKVMTRERPRRTASRE